jgi:hypothetical protein
MIGDDNGDDIDDDDNDNDDGNDDDYSSSIDGYLSELEVEEMNLPTGSKEELSIRRGRSDDRNTSDDD